LRGSVEQIQDKRHVKISHDWNAPDNFIKDFTFNALAVSHQNKVRSFDASANILELENDISNDVLPNSTFEVCSPEEAPVLATRIVTRTLPGEKLPPIQFRLATTLGTNAILERRGSSTALFITRGFEDLLEIGTQQRQDLFTFNIQKTRPLYDRVIEIDERIDANGKVLTKLSLNTIKEKAAELKDAGIQSVAIALMHSYLNPVHENILADFLRANGFTYISKSAQLAPFIKILIRAQTAVVDAYIGPVIQNYVDRVHSRVNRGTFHIMTSSGGLVRPELHQPKDSLLSGPAGGVVGAAHSARQSGFNKIIAFDMGGTSTDVSRFDGDFDYIFEHRVGDAYLKAPALAIETVAAGGGSVCTFDRFKLTVGPKSASAKPGPACYGAGGPLTVTDVNLLLGRLIDSQFGIPINKKKAQERIESIREKIKRESGEDLANEQILTGFLEIANERMAETIGQISVRRGYDTSNYALLAFGGAGGQHACAIAELLNMNTIIIPQDASILSAYGLGQAPIERIVQKQVLKDTKYFEKDVESDWRELEEQALAALSLEGIDEKDVEIRRRILNMRCTGQETSLSIEYADNENISDSFVKKYRSSYGYLPISRKFEVESMSLVAATRNDSGLNGIRQTEPQKAVPVATRKCYIANAWKDVPVYDRKTMKPGDTFKGPALIAEANSSIVIHSDWNVVKDAGAAIVCTSKTR